MSKARMEMPLDQARQDRFALEVENAVRFSRHWSRGIANAGDRPVFNDDRRGFANPVDRVEHADAA